HDLLDSRSSCGLAYLVGDDEVGRVDTTGGGAGLAVAVLTKTDALIGRHAAGAAIRGPLCGPAFTLLAGAIPADATADPECAAAVVGVVLDVAGRQGAGGKTVSARILRRLRAGHDAAHHVCIAGDVDGIAAVSGQNAALLGHAGIAGIDLRLAVTPADRHAIAHRHLRAGVHLLAFVGLCVLQALDVQFRRRHLDTLARHLSTTNRGAAAAGQGRQAAAAHMGVDLGHGTGIAVAVADVDAGGDGHGAAARAVGRGHAHVPAAGTVLGVLLMGVRRSHDVNIVLRPQVRACAAGHLRT